MHIAPPVFEKARSYLDLQINRPPLTSGVRGAPPSQYVTISRECGSGGSSLARLLAAQLNRQQPAAEGQPPWTVFDQEIVQHMLTAQDLSPTLARFLPEDKVSELTSSVGEIVGLHPNLWDLVQRTNNFLRQLALRGRVILVGRGANFATAGIAGGIHIRLTAPVDHRDRHMARVMQCPMRQASAHNRQVDAARRSYVRSVFDCDVADPLNYDLLINTAQIGLDQAAVLVAALVSLRAPAPATAAAV
jgi:cytidylate kinase